jgi:hypothetical protein
MVIFEWFREVIIHSRFDYSFGRLTTRVGGYGDDRSSGVLGVEIAN